MNKLHAAVLLSLGMFVVVAASSMAQVSPRGVDVEMMLDSVPVSLDAHSSIHKGYQAIGDIPLNLEKLYGVMCIVESPYARKDKSVSMLSLELGYVPLVIDEETTLQQFLDTTCSDGKMDWAVIRNALHIWPSKEPDVNDTNLDAIRMSLDLSGVSMLDAGKAWALAFNTNRNPGEHGVRLMHVATLVDMTDNHITPPSLITPGSITLKVEDVTAREALCAILGASAQLNWIYYQHMPDSMDMVTLHATMEERAVSEEITPEERAALNAQEDLDSVLVEPAMAGEQR